VKIFIKNRGKRGVTLIELVVVMAIIAIMGLFMAPAIGEWMDNYRIRQAAREMLSDLEFAKMKAISSGVNCAVVFNQDVDGTQYSYVIFPDYNNNLQLDGDVGDVNGDGINENETTDIFKRASLGRNISFDATQSGGDGIDFPAVGGHPSVAFDRSGLARDNAGRLTNPESIFLKNTKNDKCRQVTISLAGRIGMNDY
jgi:prepilin-type N-terminal cleavage/methylation domain-containing protein